MKFEKRFRDFTMRDGEPVLAYVSYDGDQSKVHFMVWAEGLSLGIAVTVAADLADKVLDELTDESVQRLFDGDIRPIVEKMASGEGDDGG